MVESDPFRHHAFISYATRGDELRRLLPVVDELVEMLRAAGFDKVQQSATWADRDRLAPRVPDDIIDQQIRSSIDDAIAMIAFVSPAYVRSPWCQLEYRHMARVCGADRRVMFLQPVALHAPARPASGPAKPALPATTAPTVWLDDCIRAAAPDRPWAPELYDWAAIRGRMEPVVRFVTDACERRLERSAALERLAG